MGPGAAVTIAGLIVRLAGLGHQSFWYDESVTASIVRGSLGHVFSSLPRIESTPPLYYVLAWIWTRVCGTGEVGLRSLSVVVGVATIPVAWSAASRLISPRAGLVTALLLAVNPMLVWYSQEARAYSLLVFLGAVSFLLFTRVREDPSPRHLAAWAATCCLALLTHYFAVFLIVVQLGWLLVELRPSRRAVLVAAVPMVLVATALIPLAQHQEQDGRTAWIAASPLGGRVADVTHELGTANVGLISSSSPAPHGGLGPVALALVLLGLLLSCFAPTSQQRRGASIAAVIGVGSILLALLAAAVSLDFFKDRNLIAAWVPLMMVLAAGLAARRTLVVGIAVMAAIAGLGLAVDIQVARDSDLQRQDWRALARSLGPVTETRALAIVPAYATTPLEIYGQQLAPATPNLRVRQLVIVGELPARRRIPRAFDGLTLVQERSYPGLRLLRYQSRGYFTVTAAILRAASAGMMVQAGPGLRGWLSAYSGQLIRWRRAEAALLHPGVKSNQLGALLKPDLSLLAFPPELWNETGLEASVRRIVEAARRLSHEPASPSAIATFRAALRLLL